ncbi:MAG: NAD(P)-dependent oxidoreductase [Candidatus Bathyarchaeota archaeon]|nr:MAG: NAD(P)-dependent oxidoreductase [Candidatus Bathyarchaeota archaeon]
MSKRKVVLIGAAGTIAGLLLPALKERYDLTLLDLRTTNQDGIRIKDIQIANLQNRDRNSYRRFFQKADAVVHCGFVRAVNPADPNERFWAELANVEMAYNVYQTAWEENVNRVVLASSNHAADYYEPLILDGQWDFVSPNMRALSDNYYGWAKEVYEHLGFVFAVGKMNGQPLENVQIRIGGPRETDVANCKLGDMRCVRRALAVYISQRDMSQLFIKSIETADIRNELGVPFQIFYGISDNPHAFWSIVNARQVIGYEPQDNSETRFTELVTKHIRAALAN